MSLLALQRSNQSPACLQGPHRSYQALIVVSFAADSICNITLGLLRGRVYLCLCVCAHNKHSPCSPCALVREYSCRRRQSATNARGTFVLSAYTECRGTDCHPTGWHKHTHTSTHTLAAQCATSSSPAALSLNLFTLHAGSRHCALFSLSW